MRYALVLALIGLTSATPAQVIQAGFESCVPGAVSVGGCLEAWSSGGGVAIVAPDQSGAINVAGFGFPTGGTQWGVLSASGATGALVVPPGGPAPYPLTPGSTGSLRLSNLVIPVPPAGGNVVISLEYTYCTPECTGDYTFNDFFTIDLVSPSSSLPIMNLQYLDTFSMGYASPAVTPNPAGSLPSSPCPGQEKELAPSGQPKFLSATVPPTLHGITADLVIHVGNGGDASLSSYAWIDTVRMSVQGAPLIIALSSPLGPGSIRVANQGLTPAVEVFNVFTLNEPCPGGVGTGSPPLLGLCTASVPSLAAQLLLPPGTLPFRFVPTTASAVFGPLPGGTLPSGTVIEAVAFESGLMRVAPVVRHVIP